MFDDNTLLEKEKIILEIEGGNNERLMQEKEKFDFGLRQIKKLLAKIDSD